MKIHEHASAGLSHVGAEPCRTAPRSRIFKCDARIGEGAVCGLAQGEIPNPPDLNYLRDVIDLANYLLDHGGFAVTDPQQFELYDAGRWHRKTFDSGSPNVSKPVKI